MRTQRDKSKFTGFSASYNQISKLYVGFCPSFPLGSMRRTTIFSMNQRTSSSKISGDCKSALQNACCMIFILVINWEKVYGELAIMHDGQLLDWYQNHPVLQRVNLAPFYWASLTEPSVSGRNEVKNRMATSAIRPTQSRSHHRSPLFYRKVFTMPHLMDTRFLSHGKR